MKLSKNLALKCSIFISILLMILLIFGILLPVSGEKSEYKPQRYYATDRLKNGDTLDFQGKHVVIVNCDNCCK